MVIGIDPERVVIGANGIFEFTCLAQGITEFIGGLVGLWVGLEGGGVGFYRLQIGLICTGEIFFLFFRIIGSKRTCLVLPGALFVSQPSVE